MLAEFGRKGSILEKLPQNYVILWSLPVNIVPITLILTDFTLGSETDFDVGLVLIMTQTQMNYG